MSVSDKRREQKRLYALTDKGKKSSIIRKWRQRGVIGDLDKLHEVYLNTTECNVCNKDLTTNKKCLDHCHTTG